MRTFRPEGGRYTARLEPFEVVVLRDLVGQVVEVVRADGSDPVTARLFPPASPDPETAAELRDLLHDDLREAKLANARALLESLPDDGRVSLDADAADQWLSALNDVRLALGTAIGITAESYDADPAEDDDDMHLYDWLTTMQDSLVASRLADGVGG